MDLVRGQKVKLSDAGIGSQLTVDIAIASPPTPIDVSAFGLDAQGKLSDDRYMVFYNQRTSPCGGLQVADGGTTGRFQLDLDRLPATIQKIVFVATLDGDSAMSRIGASSLSAGGITFKFAGSDFGGEKAIMIAEVYKKDVWRFAANGQGFAGGLASVLEHFGGEVADAPAPPKPAAPAPAPVPVAAPTPAPTPEAPKLNLGKITLDKKGARQSLSLKKGGTGQGATQFHINLNWDQPGGHKKGGFLGFGAKQDKVDLDLGCMFLMADGSKGCIQPLGGYFGSKNESPFIFLDKDDRSGAATDGENMHIYRPELIKKVVIFALIYEGTANFATVNGRLVIKDDVGTEILIKLDNPDPSQRFCAVALIERAPSGSLDIVKEERYFPGHRFCDEAFGFGFQWTKGQK